MTHTLLDQCRDIAACTKKLGASDAVVTLQESRSIDIEWRDGRLERLQQQGERGLRVELYVEGRYGASTTSDLRPAALESFLEQAVTLVKMLEPDPYRSLPDPSRYARELSLDLDLHDATRDSYTTDERIALAADLEARLRSESPRLPIISVESSVSDSESESARVHTNGFEAQRRGTRFGCSVSAVVAAEGRRRPSGAAGSVRRHRAELERPEALASRAAARAARQLKLEKLPTGRYMTLVENRTMGRLIGAFLAPLSGSALQQKSSLWQGRLGERVASPLLTLHDDPLRPRGLSSSLWDGDGFACVRRPILESGVLRTYLIDDYYARKLGVEPTGGSLHNLAWSTGPRSLEELAAEVGEGVLIEGFLGGNQNSSSGALSVGCSGRVIRRGALAESFAEVNLSGHFGELFESLVALGNDPDPNSSVSAPTCVFEGVQLSGS